ncbi:hypothetical protein KAR91_00195 [Candidatus Pacearchaeota archaeon]|nr:hypothetical protein [Candidatus Pacearchaeota archaeon]
MKISANNILLRLLGLLFLAGAVLKGHQLLTEPMANVDIWSNRYFFIFTVEFELALAIWLLSGMFKKIAWIATVACFSLFCCITLYKGLAGYGSCGCFGRVHVNPWITLIAIDLPCLLALLIFRPKDLKLKHLTEPLSLLTPSPKTVHLVAIFLLALTCIAVTILILAFNEPAAVASTYEILEPETWVGKELPILEQIDIKDKISKGNWLVMLYHHDCPSCAEAIPKIEQMARDLEGNEDFLRVALIEVPPYEQFSSAPTIQDGPCLLGRLDTSKEWFVTTPALVLLVDGITKNIWEINPPSIKKIQSLL